MINIMKNTARILFKRKSFFITTFILPILIILGFTSLYSANSSISVGIINNDKGAFGEEIVNKLKDLEGIKLMDVNESDSDYMKDLIYHKYEIVIKIDENFTEDMIENKKGKINYDSLSESETSAIVQMMIKDQVSSIATLCNNIDVKAEGVDKILDTYKNSKPEIKVTNDIAVKPPINQSLGIILYTLFVSAGISCAFLLEDEAQGTKERILMGKVSEKQYFGAECLIFSIFAAVPAIEYYIVCNLMDYNFGFEDKIILLILVLLMSIFAVVFSIMMTSLVKKKSLVTLAISTITVPMFMISGCFWPFDMMGETLQKIGNMLPPRWIFMAVENLQKGQELSSVVPMIIGMVLISVVTFLLSIFFTRNKIVLVKEDK